MNIYANGGFLTWTENEAATAGYCALKLKETVKKKLKQLMTTSPTQNERTHSRHSVASPEKKKKRT